MQRSTNRILTTHTGSLPRPAALVQLLLEEQEKPGANRAALEAAIRDAVAGVVAKQIECGLDIINDGEQGRTDYTVHVKDRLSGFEGPSSEPRGTGDEEFPELALLLKQFASPFQHRPACSGPIAWKDWPAVEADLARAKSATESATASRRQGSVHDLAVAGADRPLPQECLLPRRRGLSHGARRHHEARIPGDRRCRLRPPARLSGSRDVAPHDLSAPEHRRLPQGDRRERRRAQPRGGRHSGGSHAHARMLGLDHRPASQRRSAARHRRRRARREASGGVVSRRQSAPRPRMEGVARGRRFRRARSSSRA